jgi:hypothetical protein
MTQVSDRPRFAEETRPLLIAARTFFTQHLDRDESMQLSLASEIDGAERATPESPDDLVPVSELTLAIDPFRVVFAHGQCLLWGP